jgi:hypothetical protein
LRDPELLGKIKCIESNRRRGKGAEVYRGYQGLDEAEHNSIRKIDELLKDKSRNIPVTWLFGKQDPFDDDSLSINRFLVSRLRMQNSPNLRLVSHANVVMVSREHRHYLVKYTKGSAQEEDPIKCRQALVRFGTRKLDRGSNRYLFQSVARVFEDHSSQILGSLNDFLNPNKNHDHCNIPWGWQSDRDFQETLKPGPRKCPTLLAEFVMAFYSPDPALPGAPIVYRIRIWLLDVNEQLKVKYDLHPTENNKPISRIGTGAYHEQWLNTRNDYSIRVRTSDGFEWPVGKVLEALRRRYDLSEAEDEANGADPASRKPIKGREKQRDGTFKDSDGTEQVNEAMERIENQTKKRNLTT